MTSTATSDSLSSSNDYSNNTEETSSETSETSHQLISSNNNRKGERKGERKGRKGKGKGRKGKWLIIKVIVGIICFMIFIIIINSLIIIILYQNQNRNILLRYKLDKYKYKMVYNDEEEGTSFENEFWKDRKAQSFNFNDERGSGYIYPLEYDDGKNEEYEIEGECECCVECLDDEGCGKESGEEREGKYCVENVCVECKSNGECENELICNRGRCIKGNCRDYEDCKSDEICTSQGECIKGCKDDSECEKYGQICGSEAKCIKGCRRNDECNDKKGEICLKNTCSIGCNDNFDCNAFELVCINNKCMNTENTETCTDDDECELGSYCDLEYMICIPSTKRSESITMNERRDEESIPVVCVYYGVGVASLFILASSYTIATNVAEDKLIDKCYEKCSEVYNMYMGRIKLSKATSKKTTKDDVEREKKFRCTGKCEIRTALKLIYKFFPKEVANTPFLETCDSIQFGNNKIIADNVKKAKKIFNVEQNIFRCKAFEMVDDELSGKFPFRPCQINKKATVCV